MYEPNEIFPIQPEGNSKSNFELFKQYWDAKLMEDNFDKIVYDIPEERKQFILKMAMLGLVNDESEPDGTNLVRISILSDEEWNWLYSNYKRRKAWNQIIK